MRNRIVLVSVTVLGVLAAAPAFAKSLCFYEGATLRLVARPWKAPAPGKCRAFVGTGGGAGSGMASGTVCLSADGSVLRFGIAVHHQGALFASPYTDNIAMGMAYPSLSSSGASVTTVTFGEAAVGAESWGAIQASTCPAPEIG
jgi:hypothetical protein